MSTVDKATDTILVSRDGTDYRTTVETMSTLADTDLLLINRGGVDYRCEAKDVKAALGGSPLGEGTEINPEGLDVFGFGWDLAGVLWSNPGSVLIYIYAYTQADKKASSTHFAKTTDGGLTWTTAATSLFLNYRGYPANAVAYYEPHSSYYFSDASRIHKSTDGLTWTPFAGTPTKTAENGVLSLGIMNDTFYRWGIQVDPKNSNVNNFWRCAAPITGPSSLGAWTTTSGPTYSVPTLYAWTDPYAAQLYYRNDSNHPSTPKVDSSVSGSFYGNNFSRTLNLAGATPIDWHNGCAFGSMPDGYVWKTSAAGHVSSLCPIKGSVDYVMADFTRPYVLGVTTSGTTVSTTDMQTWIYTNLTGWSYQTGQCKGLATDGSHFLIFNYDTVTKASKIFRISY
jgi:hypothetical protein